MPAHSPFVKVQAPTIPALAASQEPFLILQEQQHAECVVLEHTQLKLTLIRLDPVRSVPWAHTLLERRH